MKEYRQFIRERFMSELFDLLSLTPAKSTIHCFIDWLVNKNSYQEKYKKISDDNETDNNLFLSIVMRTQGKRPEALEEVLLNLRDQVQQNFEVILIAHKISDDNEKVVKLIIESLPSDIKDKIRYYNVNEGTRTSPLNYGFALSKGRYISMLDDDDIVYDNWVEEFYKAASDNDGKLIHTYCLFQDWSYSPKGTSNILKSVNDPVDIYCRNYNYILQYYSNCCPNLSLAFPSFVFKKLNMHFDETLTTTEDWDYILRVANVAGVVDVEKVTCLYRNWVNLENSHSTHTQNEWDKNYGIISHKMSECPKLISHDFSFEVFKKFLNDRYVYTQTFNHAKLYYKDDLNFSEDLCLYFNKDITDKNLNVSVLRNEFKDCNIRYLRFDPTEFAKILLKEFCCTIILNNGKVKTLGLNDCMHNGVRYGSSIYFPLEDPYIVFKLPRNLDFIKISINYDFSDENDEVDKTLISKSMFNGSR